MKLAVLTGGSQGLGLLQPHPFRVVNVNHFVMDTAMQEQIQDVQT